MKSSLRVRDVMSRDVTTLKRNEKLSIADDVMRLGRIRHLPIVDDDDEHLVVGVLSQRDLFRGSLARALGYGETAQQKLLGMLSVKEVMTNEVATVGPDTPIAEAARTMMNRKIGCLVVVEEAKLVGILTEGDFVRIVAQDA